MPKKILFLQAVILLSLSACLNNNADKKGSNQGTNTSPTQKTSDTTIKITSEEQFEKITQTSEKIVVVDFEAPWCSACRDLEPHIIAASSKAESYTFVRINIDTLPNLGKKFGIVGIPTLIFMHKGKELEASRLIGPAAKNSDDLLSIIKAAIEKNSTPIVENAEQNL